MHIEVFEQERVTEGRTSWYWRFCNGGRITANNEAFVSKGNAIRAAKGVVKATVKEVVPPELVVFTKPVWLPDRMCYVIEWN